MSESERQEYYEFDGITYMYKMPAAILCKIRDDLVLHPGDIVIATYPKSGTTWMEEIIYSIMEGSQKARERTQPMDTIIRFVEFDIGKTEGPTNYDHVVAAAPPRIIKTHLNTNFFKRALETTEDGPKFIVIARNPKDTLVSDYHHQRVLQNSLGNKSWDEFFDTFKQNKLPYGDVIDYHVRWWSLRNQENILFLQYETMLADSTKAIQQVADFLGRHLSEEELAAIAEGSSFTTMKARGAASYHQIASLFDEAKTGFFRKGKKGDWRNYFSDEQSNHVDQLVETMATPVGLSYKF